MKLTNNTDASAWNALRIVSVANIPVSSAFQPPAADFRPAPPANATALELMDPASLAELMHDRACALAAEEAERSGRLEVRQYAEYRKRRLSPGN